MRARVFERRSLSGCIQAQEIVKPSLDMVTRPISENMRKSDKRSEMERHNMQAQEMMQSFVDIDVRVNPEREQIFDKRLESEQFSLLPQDMVQVALHTVTRSIP